MAEGKLAILEEGRFVKFVQHVGQVTFSGKMRLHPDQEVLYVTERCVFRLGDGRRESSEIAPGIDLDKDVLARLPFKPGVRNLKPMDASLFYPQPLNLRQRMLDIRIEDRLSYDAESNTVFMNYAGMRVRTLADLDRIREAVERLLEAAREACLFNRQL